MNSSQLQAPQKLLITGATGFIGARLALRAHQLGIDVLATGRVELPVEAERRKSCGRGRSRRSRHAAGSLARRSPAARTDTVIHLAAAQHEAEMPEAYFRAVNVDAVRTLLAACRDHNVRRFVYGSTIGVYGEAGESLLDEDSPVRPENIYTQHQARSRSPGAARSAITSRPVSCASPRPTGPAISACSNCFVASRAATSS